MPQLFKIGNYWVYFWSNEGIPVEPVHVSSNSHVQNATKIWITRAGKCLVCHNKSKIPANILNNIKRMIELKTDYITQKWQERFGEISYYC